MDVPWSRRVGTVSRCGRARSHTPPATITHTTEGRRFTNAALIPASLTPSRVRGRAPRRSRAVFQTRDCPDFQPLQFYTLQKREYTCYRFCEENYKSCSVFLAVSSKKEFQGIRFSIQIRWVRSPDYNRFFRDSIPSITMLRSKSFIHKSIEEIVIQNRF